MAPYDSLNIPQTPGLWGESSLHSSREFGAVPYLYRPTVLAQTRTYDHQRGDGMTLGGSLREIVTINGKQHWAFIDRVKRQIILKSDVQIALTDTIVVNDMTGAIDVVEHDGHYTVVRLG